jgi:hypothetical protein
MMELEQALLNVYNTKDRQAAEPFAEGGTVVEAETETTPEMDRMLMEAQQGVAEGAQQDPNASLVEYIDELMAQRDQAEDPSERAQIEHMAEAAVLSQEAPMAPQAFEIAAQGRGEDTALAHLRPGEVVLPPEMFEDPEFERMVESRFGELDLDPEAHVVGLGIASLNPITGLEEFGFFKKIAKGIKKVVKKVVKPIAKVAQFVPGPWQPIAALANKAFTVYDVAKGRANPLSLLTVAGPLATGGGLGKNISDISKAGSGSFLGGLGKGLLGTGSALRGGIGSLFSNPVEALTKDLPNLLKTANYQGMSPAERTTDAVSRLRELTQDPKINELVQEFRKAGLNPVQQIQALQQAGAGGSMLGNIFSGQTSLGNILGGTGQPGQQSGGGLGGLLGGGQPGQSQLGLIEDFLKGRPSGPVRQGGGIGSLFGGGGGGGGFDLGTLGALGAAGLIGKLAYDEAKNMRGVPLTPLTQEGSTGRYNIEAEIARRTGQPAPDPVEFGLLPEGTIPTLSGGRRAPEQEQEPVMQARYGGPVMAFAEGGDVAIEDFKRMDGPINGPGTEVSDDIPAMLSDGEFVMTGRAVRGAGAFDLQRGDGGILTLTPNGSESRDKGTNLMYEMMELFSEFADKPKRAAA